MPKDVSEIKKPEDLAECIEWLLAHESKENLDHFRDLPEHKCWTFHHTGGTTMRNAWGLWDEKSDLHRFFVSIGIWHADDMSGIIYRTLHRVLNRKPADLKGQIEHYQRYWAKTGGE